jgi:hypothetical protein
MRIDLNPAVTVTTDDGPVTCNVGKVSLAASDNLAIRVVPVDDDGVEYPAASIAVVGADRPDTEALMDAIGRLVSVLVKGRRDNPNIPTVPGGRR